MKAQDKSHIEIQKILNRRGEEQIKSSISYDECEKIILTAASDLGVIRNDGRRGAAFGPSCIINAFKKFACHLKDNKKIQLLEIPQSHLSFNQLQQEENEAIKLVLSAKDRTHICHLGGGHDHIYPLIKALTEHFKKKIHIINIDAHLDTRDDEFYHSGTPFRQIMRELKDVRLSQIGIQDISNIPSNWNKMNMSVHRLSDLTALTKNFTNYDEPLIEKILNINSREITVFSIDLDAICGHEFSSVSAVNAQGMPLHFVKEMLAFYLKTVEQNIVGLYEYNPMFDDLAAKDAKVCADLMNMVLI